MAGTGSRSGTSRATDAYRSIETHVWIKRLANICLCQARSESRLQPEAYEGLQARERLDGLGTRG